MSQFDAIIAGLICLDIIPRFDGPATLVAGRVTEIGPAALVTGGAVANTGLALHRLGIKTGLLCKLGDDLFGQAILDIVRGIDPALTEGMVTVPGEISSYTLVLNPPNLDRTFFHCPGAGHTFSANDVNYEWVSQARLFHLGYPPYMRALYSNGARELIEVYQRVKALSVTTSMDMALPDPAGPSGQVDWPDVLARVLPDVDLFMPSAEELCFMLDRRRYDALQGHEPDVETVLTLAEHCIELGARIVLVKCGARGLYARTASLARIRGMGRAMPDDPAGWSARAIWSPCFAPHALVRTTGTGDATIAGFLASLLRGETFDTAATMACAVGACNVEAADALSGIRTWDDTSTRVANGWLRQPVTLPKDWIQQPNGLWRLHET